MQCAIEQSVEKLLDRLSTSPSFSQMQDTQITPLEKFNDGVYRLSSVNGEKKMSLIPDFSETVSLTDLKSKDSVVGEVLGASLTGTVAALVNRFIPIAGIPSGLAAALAAYFIGKKFAKTGFGAAVVRGIIIGGGTSVAYPIVEKATAGLNVGGGGT